MAEIYEITQGETPKSRRRFDIRDWNYLSEYIISEYEVRKRKREDLERHWKEIDRQVAMTPDIEYKYIREAGVKKIDPGKAWMSEIEPPLQAQALEVLVADARRMGFPDSGPWFAAHAETTDEYLENADVRIAGDENEVPSLINQDNADKLCQGFLIHLFGQTDLYTRVDRCNAEAFKYGMGVGRARTESKNVYLFEARGVRTEKQKLPVLVPASIKNVYLDDPMPSMHSSQVLGPAHISEDYMRLENLRMAANAGSSDPENPNGGWMPRNIAGLESDENGYVKLLEMEGDIVIPRKTVRSMVIPRAIVTVAVGAAEKNGKVTSNVVRFRFRKQPFSSYLLFPYHYENANDAYPTSPLMKGRPLQIMVAQALNRLLDSAALKNAPPVGYDRSDQLFAQSGGPGIYPYAKWGTIDDLKVHSDVGGDPSALSGALQLAINLYAELTGILPARLGAQTVSHTTAYAKNAELERGATRTVDYVRQTGQGAMTQWLDMAYKMGREALGNGRISFYIEPYGGFVECGAKDLPENVMWEWFGSGGPAEEQAIKQLRIQSLQFALQMDVLNQQLKQAPPVIDVEKAIRQILKEGKWSDVDAILGSGQGAAGGPQAAPGLPAVAQGGGGPAVAALQAIQGGAG